MPILFCGTSDLLCDTDSGSSHPANSGKTESKLQMGVEFLMTDFAFDTDGPAFVFVNDGAIVRMAPADLAEDKSALWEFEDRERCLKALHKRSVAVYTQGYMSMVYSDKRVDFDPDAGDGKRICNLSGYERVAWEERSFSRPAGSPVFSAPTTWLPLGCLLA